MQLAADERTEFAPPPQPGILRAGVLAVLAHLLLLAALTSGLQWKREPTEVAAEAELWSAVPREAAPREVVPPTPPAAPVAAAPPAPPAPPPVVRAPAQPDPQVQRDAQIALEREKDRREKERREDAERREEAKRQAAAERREDERERKAEADRKLAAERKRDELAERKREEEADKREQAKLAAEARRKEQAQKELAQKKREEQEAQRVARMREDNLKRMQGLAGGTGSPSSGGSAQQASGPSSSWAGRIVGKVRPNIVFSDDVAGNPRAEVEVRMAPDGTIVGKRLTKSSGNKSWDDAVLRALDKTEVLPRDTDGRVHSPVTITFRPKD